MQFLDLEIKLTSLTEQIIFHDVEMCDRRPERAWDFSQRMEPATIDDQGCDVDDDCRDDRARNPSPRAVQ